MTQVVMNQVLAQALADRRGESLYHKDGDWMFAASREKGRIPRSASICAQDYLRPACGQGWGHSGGLSKAIWVAQSAAQL